MQGAILQAVVAWHAARQQAEADAAPAGAEGAERGTDAERRALNSNPTPNPTPIPNPNPDPDRTVPQLLTRRTLNSADGKRGEAGPLLARLGPEATLALAEAAADLRALIKVKVADDQDLKTAQQAVAEAAHFFVALQQEAAGLGVSADEQLQHYVQ